MHIQKSQLRITAYTYLKEILRRKWQLVFGAIVTVILFILSTHYLFEGFNKRFLVYTALCLMTGVFIILPRLKRWYLVLPVVLLYLVFVPKRIFFRIELPVHDLSSLMDGALLANLMIIYLVYAVFFLISQRPGVAFGCGGILLLVLTIVNYYVVQFRGTSLSFTDLLATRTAMTVMKSYHLSMSTELWYSILYFIFFIALGFWCNLPFKKGVWYHTAVTGVSLVYLVSFWMFWGKSDYLEEHELHGIHWQRQLNQPLEGFLLSFGLNIQEMSMARPFGYSEGRLREIAEEAGASYQPPSENQAEQPTIIFIMNEAWSELKVMGNLETSEPYMSFVDSLAENTVKGRLTVEILGGLTANTEFEVLTGDSLAFLSPSAVPYELQVNHEMYSLARVMEEQGYQTMAMHPSVYHAWNRSNVYSYMGFEEFIDIYKFQTEYEYMREYISDECNFKEIIWQFEHKRENTPLFLFDVTIQNHGGYEGGNGSLSIEKVGSRSAEEVKGVNEAEDYLNLLRITDQAFERLISYFETVDEPVIICMFGDHQPLLSGEFYNAIFEGQELTAEEQNAMKYVVPYVIWANYDAAFSEYGDMSANYLGAVVLECAGAELPPYYQFLLNLWKHYPVISYQTIMDIKTEEPIVQYQMLQYNHLMERKYIKDLFSVSP